MSIKKRAASPIYFLLVLCLFLPLLTSCSSRKTIVNGLDEKEANEIIVFLSTKNVDASKIASTGGGGPGGGHTQQLWDIEVPSEQAIEAMSYLNQVGLPRRRAQSLLGIFTGAGLVPSELEQKIRYQAGLAEQIASIIRKIDGILDAEVQVSFPEEDPLNPGVMKGKITASVYVKHNGVLDDPNSHLITKIKRLVAASITGLDYDNVTIISERARYSEEQLAQMWGSEEEKQYVSVWSLILAKESLTRFRVIFFTFTMLLLSLLLSLIWLLWKIFPLLREYGLKELFRLKPIYAKKEIPETPAAGPPPETKPEEGTDRNIDQT
jgi:type III secretion protein J